MLISRVNHTESTANSMMCVCKAHRVNKPLTGWITPKVATAQTHTAAPQLEASLGHALPLGAHLVVGLCKCVVAGIPVGCYGYVAWNCSRRAEEKKLFNTWGDIMCGWRLESQRLTFAVVASINWQVGVSSWRCCRDAFENLCVMLWRAFTSIAHGYNFLQNLLFSPVGHCFHQDIVRSSRCESNECSTVGGAGQTHLLKTEADLDRSHL